MLLSNEYDYGFEIETTGDRSIQIMHFQLTPNQYSRIVIKNATYIRD